MAVYTYESGGLEEGEDGPLVHALSAGLPAAAQRVHLPRHHPGHTHVKHTPTTKTPGTTGVQHVDLEGASQASNLSLYYRLMLIQALL